MLITIREVTFHASCWKLFFQLNQPQPQSHSLTFGMRNSTPLPWDVCSEVLPVQIFFSSTGVPKLDSRSVSSCGLVGTKKKGQFLPFPDSQVPFTRPQTPHCCPELGLHHFTATPHSSHSQTGFPHQLIPRFPTEESQISRSLKESNHDTITK